MREKSIEVNLSYVGVKQWEKNDNDFYLFFQIGEEFKGLLIRDCLAEAVPYSRAQLDQFEEVKQSAEQFQQFLIEKGRLLCTVLSIISVGNCILVGDPKTLLLSH